MRSISHQFKTQRITGDRDRSIRPTHRIRQLQYVYDDTNDVTLLHLHVIALQYDLQLNIDRN